LRYSVPISGLPRGVCAERPESRIPASWQARFDAEGIVQHGHAVEVARLAEELPAPVDHGLDVLVAQLGGLGHAPLEGLVVVSDELHVHAEADLRHTVLLFGSLRSRLEPAIAPTT